MSSAAGRFAKNSGTWEIAHRRAVRKGEGKTKPQGKGRFREVFWSVGGGGGGVTLRCITEMSFLSLLFAGKRESFRFQGTSIAVTLPTNPLYSVIIDVGNMECHCSKLLALKANENMRESSFPAVICKLRYFSQFLFK